MSKKSKKKSIKDVVPKEKPKMEPQGNYLIKNGVMFLSGEFNKENILPIIQQIVEYNLMDEELQPEEIKLIINSPGGAVHWCWHLIDTMKMSQLPILTLGHGLVASCGTLTLMSGDKRVITHNTSVMSHTYSWGSRGKEGELKAIVKEFDLSSERMIEHYKKCTGKSERYIRKNLLHPHDEWLTPEECVKHKLVDEVWATY